MDEQQRDSHSQDLSNVTLVGCLLTLLSAAIALICGILVVRWAVDRGARGRELFLNALFGVIPGAMFFGLGHFLLTRLNIRVFRQGTPAPAFEQFERVLVKAEGPLFEKYHGERGTVLWRDSYYVRQKPTQPDLWIYIVHLPTRSCWETFLQSDLESEGAFDPEVAHLGQRPEISFDTELEEDNDWIEGSFRLPGEFWKVMIFQKDDVPETRHEPGRWAKSTKWEQETTGVIFRFPRKAKVDRQYLLRVMSHAFGYSEWAEVKGPDSRVLRKMSMREKHKPAVAP